MGEGEEEESRTGNVHYLRHGHFYVILATYGAHKFFESEKARMKDARETPIRVGGDAISYRRSRGGRSWHPSVRIELERYLDLKAYYEKIVVHRSVEALCQDFATIGFEAYAPVKNQLATILRFVNRNRKAAGFLPVPRSVLPRLRRSVVALKSEPNSDDAGEVSPKNRCPSITGPTTRGAGRRSHFWGTSLAREASFISGESITAKAGRIQRVVFPLPKKTTLVESPGHEHTTRPSLEA